MKKKIIALAVAAVLVITTVIVTGYKLNWFKAEKTVPDDFYISYSWGPKWGPYEMSSYDSLTGELVKVRTECFMGQPEEHTPEEYITTYFLTDEQKKKLYQKITDTDILSYPDIYKPYPEWETLSQERVTVKVRYDNKEKEIVCYPYPAGIMEHPELNKIETDDEKANDFISLCSTIEKILTASDEWKALPYYETYID